MDEDFLQHIWKHKLYHAAALKTVDGQPLEIFKPGQHNYDSGPDFFNAQIRIGLTKWAGNVEIHHKSSDWKKHNHQADRAYSNVILHVVYEHDEDIHTSEGRVIPTFELAGKFDKKLYENYLSLLKNSDWIPCENKIRIVDESTINLWMERLVIERLEAKTNDILNNLLLNKNNWEETFYIQLAKNFGFKINSVPFELLAKSLPINILGKHKSNLIQIEALLFGQAGLLNKKFKDEYPQTLKDEYDFLKAKYGLKPVEGSLWKFLRLRPVNFPTIRIAQFAKLIFSTTHLFSRILEQDSLKKIRELFDTGVSDYWESHFTIDKISPTRKKELGEQSIAVLMINTVIPFLFTYGKHYGSEEHKERAVKWLETIPAESNSIIKHWDALGIKADSAAASQALLQLKNNYCSPKKCLFCRIGNKILNVTG